MASIRDGELWYQDLKIGSYSPKHIETHTYRESKDIFQMTRDAEVDFDYSFRDLNPSGKEEVLSFLARLQDEEGFEALHLLRFELADYKDEEVKEEFLRDKWVYPFTYDFFPRRPDLYLKQNYLDLWCPDPSDQSVRAKYLPDITYGQLQSEKAWSRYLDWEVEVQKDPSVFALVFKYGPEACYPSGLPRTRMAHIHGGKKMGDIYPASTKINLPSGKFLYYVDASGVKYIPVVRYASGAYGTLFHGDKYDEEDSCGTFFYYEAMGDSVLRCQKMLVSRNKYTAMKELVPLLPEGEKKKRREEGIRTFEKSWGKKAIDADSGLSERSPETYLNALYAKEDVFDLTLCRAGKELGYEVLVFTHMAGTERLVTEVLDTRSREESIENLFALDY